MQVSKIQLQENLLEYLQIAETNGEEIIITDSDRAGGGKADRPILKISPYTISPTTEELFGKMRGKVRYFEDLNVPTIDEWQEV